MRFVISGWTLADGIQLVRRLIRHCRIDCGRLRNLDSERQRVNNDQCAHQEAKLFLLLITKWRSNAELQANQ